MNRKNICEKRKTVYTLLAYLLLNEPTNDTLRKLVSNRELLCEIADDQSLFTGSLDNKSLESFVQEYYDRFFVTSSKRFIPPFEYAIRHRTENEQKVRFGKLLSKQSFHIADCYEAVGFSPDRVDMFEPLREMQYPDHIAYEMSFMVYLLNGEEKAYCVSEDHADVWQDRQYQFLSEHLATWTEDLYNLSREKQDGLYTEILNVINQWVQADLQYVNDRKIH